MIAEGHRCRITDSNPMLHGLRCAMGAFYGPTIEIVLAQARDVRIDHLIANGVRGVLTYRDDERDSAYRQAGVFSAGAERDVLRFRSADLLIAGIRRDHSRAPLPVPVEIISRDERGTIVADWSGVCADIAASGIRVADGATIPIRARHSIELTMPGGAKLTTDGLVAWHRNGHTALAMRCPEETKRRIGELTAIWYRGICRKQFGGVARAA